MYTCIYFSCVYTYSINSARVHAGCVALTHEARFLRARGGGHRMRFSPRDIWYRTNFFGAFFFWGICERCVRRERKGEKNREGEGSLSLSPQPSCLACACFFSFFFKSVCHQMSRMVLGFTLYCSANAALRTPTNSAFCGRCV